MVTSTIHVASGSWHPLEDLPFWIPDQVETPELVVVRTLGTDLSPLTVDAEPWRESRGAKLYTETSEALASGKPIHGCGKGTCIVDLPSGKLRVCHGQWT